MSLAHELDRYLSVRRSLGADLRTDERILRRFVTFADNDGVTHTSTDLFLRWHATLAEAGSSTRAARLSKVRLFAQWLSSLDSDHEVPPRGLLPDRYRRVRPYIYSEAEVIAIVEHARTLPSIYGMRGLTCSMLFSFGSKKYAFEELVAEMNAAFCCASLGIVPTVRHADYIASWLEVLREDNRAIVRAASQASKAADFLLGFLPDDERAATDAEPAAA